MHGSVALFLFEFDTSVVHYSALVSLGTFWIFWGTPGDSERGGESRKGVSKGLGEGGRQGERGGQRKERKVPLGEGSPRLYLRQCCLNIA